MAAAITPTSDPRQGQPSPSARRVTALLCLSGLAGLAYVALQCALLIHWHRLAVLQLSPGEVPDAVLPALAAATARYAGLVLLTLALIVNGRKASAFTPIVGWLILAWWLTRSAGIPPLVGEGWLHLGARVAWVGALIDLMLICIPCVVVLRLMPRGGRRAPAGLAAVALTYCLAVTWIVAFAPAVGGSIPWGSIRDMLPLLLFALLLELPSVAWACLIVLVSVLLTVDWQRLLGAGGPQPLEEFRIAIPAAAGALAVAAWAPVAWLVGRARRLPPIVLVLALNLLNVIDAILTALEVKGGSVSEFNPIVRVSGLPAKVILVGVLSLMLMRFRPQALIWPILIFVLVVAWHVTGLMHSAG